MDKERFNYEADSTIDPNGLDIAYLEDAKITMKYLEALADAQARLRELHETEVPVAKAELASCIRKNPTLFDIDKLTEGALKEVLDLALSEKAEIWSIVKLGDYKELVTNYRYAHRNELEAEHEVDILRGAARSMDKRTGAIEGLAYLLGKQYFAGPKIPRDLNEEFRKYVDSAEAKRKIDVRERIKERLNRKSPNVE